jgi:Zn-dependent M28 family amino/carboxypeptidase
MKKLFFLFFYAFSAYADYAFDQQITDAVELVNKELWFEDVVELASFNRYYKNPEIHKARDLIKNKFEELGLITKLEEIKIDTITGYNIIGEIRGIHEPDNIYIIGAHYDSISEQPMRLAPGAEDNASGTAGLFALARALKAHPPRATVRFVAFSGEEAGLFGSTQHVENIINSNEQKNIHGVLIMDMIAYTKNNTLGIILETSEAHKELVNLLSSAAKKYTKLSISPSYNYWGSDHVPFINNNFNTVLIIEKDYSDYRHYHRSTDLPQNLSKELAHEVLKAMTATIGFWIYNQDTPN